MRKLVWLLAIILSVGLWLHIQNDHEQVRLCADTGELYDFHLHTCSTKEANKHSSQGFWVTHTAFGLSWAFAVFLAALSFLIKFPVKAVGNGPEPSDKKKLLMIDNYDSFTYNLIQYFGEIGLEFQNENDSSLELIVKRNDEINFDEIVELDPDYIVISPGPCTPNESGISLEVIEKLAVKKPILGVCLGHQAMAQVYGGEVIRADQVMHGKTSEIYHNSKGVFKNLPSPFKATRYHSLVVNADTLPKAFEVTAWTENEKGELEYIMGIRHKTFDMEGVQFHPESILSEHGHQILRNFLLKQKA